MKQKILQDTDKFQTLKICDFHLAVSWNMCDVAINTRSLRFRFILSHTHAHVELSVTDVIFKIGSNVCSSTYVSTLCSSTSSYMTLYVLLLSISANICIYLKGLFFSVNHTEQRRGLTHSTSWPSLFLLSSNTSFCTQLVVHAPTAWLHTYIRTNMGRTKHI